MLKLTAKLSGTFILKLNGKDTMPVEVLDVFVDPGIRVTDAFGNPFPANVQVNGTVNTNEPGLYSLWYVVDDGLGNSDSVQRIVKVADTQRPTINLMGIYEVHLAVGEEYYDFPILLEDNFDTDADMRAYLTIKGNMPFNSKGIPFLENPGFYKIYYSTTDRAGNMSDDTSRVLSDEINNRGVRTIYAIPTGLNDQLAKNTQIQVYPNPMMDELFIKADLEKSSSFEITITALTGEKIIVKTFQNESKLNEKINVSQLKAGSYLIHFDSNENTYSKKLIKL